MPELPVNPVIIGAVAVALLALVAGWADMAYMGLAARLWSFGREKSRLRSGEQVVLHKRFGKAGPLVGWIMAPHEVIVTSRRLIINYRNAFTRLDIPLTDLREVSVTKRPWPLSDDILLIYLDGGSTKKFLLPESSVPVLKALRRAGASFKEV